MPSVRTRTRFIPTPDMVSETVTGEPGGRPAHWLALHSTRVVGVYSHSPTGWWAAIPGREATLRTEQAARRWISRHTTGAELTQMAGLIR